MIRAVFDLNLSSVKKFVYDVSLEKKSREFSQNEIDTLKNLMPDVRSSENTVRTISIKTEDLTNCFHFVGRPEKNLRITGLPENPGEKSEQTQV